MRDADGNAGLACASKLSYPPQMVVLAACSVLTVKAHVEQGLPQCSTHTVIADHSQVDGLPVWFSPSGVDLPGCSMWATGKIPRQHMPLPKSAA